MPSCRSRTSPSCPALTLAGPGRLSLDSLLGIRIPRRVALAALAGTLGAVYVTARREIDAGTAKVNEVGVETEREATGGAR